MFQIKMNMYYTIKKTIFKQQFNMYKKYLDAN